MTDNDMTFYNLFFICKCPNMKLLKCFYHSSYYPLLLKHLKGLCHKKSLDYKECSFCVTNLDGRLCMAEQIASN